MSFWREREPLTSAVGAVDAVVVVFHGVCGVGEPKIGGGMASRRAAAPKL